MAKSSARTKKSAPKYKLEVTSLLDTPSEFTLPEVGGQHIVVTPRAKKVTLGVALLAGAFLVGTRF